MSERGPETLLQDPLPLARDAHGVIRVGGTRVPLETVILCYKNGASPEQIQESFPALSLADVHASIAYFLRHSEEVEAYLAARQVEDDAIEAEVRRRFPTADLRQRLIQRERRGSS